MHMEGGHEVYKTTGTRPRGVAKLVPTDEGVIN